MPHSADIVQDELRGHVRSIVDLSTERRKTAIDFAARALGMSFARVKKLYYGEPLAVRAHEADQIRAYVEAASKLIQARADYEVQREAFVRSNPAMAKLAPPPLAGSAVPQTDEQAAVVAPSSGGAP